MSEEPPKYKLHLEEGRYPCELLVYAKYSDTDEQVAEISKRSRLLEFEDKKHPWWYSLTITKIYNAPPRKTFFNCAGSSQLDHILTWLKNDAFYKNGQWWFGEDKGYEQYRPPKEQYMFKCGCGYDYFAFFGDCMLCECCGRKYRLIEDDTVPAGYESYSG